MPLILILLVLQLQVAIPTESGDKESCKSLRCSNIVEPVCGMLHDASGKAIYRDYLNICHLNKASCSDEVSQVDLTHCRHGQPGASRRVQDFSIVGAHQSCNHSCPTYCVDTYEPVCAKIHHKKRGARTFVPMINHCHVDFFSCALGYNVTIHPLSKCYKNTQQLLFMTVVASMKSLSLLGRRSGSSGAFGRPNSASFSLSTDLGFEDEAVKSDGKVLPLSRGTRRKFRIVPAKSELKIMRRSHRPWQPLH